MWNCETDWQIGEKWWIFQPFIDKIFSLDSNILISKNLDITIKYFQEVCASHQRPKILR